MDYHVVCNVIHNQAQAWSQFYVKSLYRFSIVLDLIRVFTPLLGTGVAHYVLSSFFEQELHSLHCHCMQKVGKGITFVISNMFSC